MGVMFMFNVDKLGDAVLAGDDPGVDEWLSPVFACGGVMEEKVELEV